MTLAILVSNYSAVSQSFQSNRCPKFEMKEKNDRLLIFIFIYNGLSC